MEKTLTIDGRDVRFKSTAATPLRYKAQFQKDFFADLISLESLRKIQTDSGEINYAALQKIDFEVLYNLFWVFAKTADKAIPDPITWLDGFSEFPIFELLPEIQDLITMNLKQSKKK